MIVWCVAMDIKTISLYDLDGKLKEKNNLNIEISKKLPLPIQESQIVQWNTHSVLHTSKSHNGFKISDNTTSKEMSKDIIKLNVLSKEDGQHEFNIMAKSLAKKIKSGQLLVDSIDENLIDSSLNGILGISDPDLLIRFGLASSNLGFLPWHIRLTEIHDIPTHFDIECWDIFRVLQRYSKCEQR
jgi:undecaprenyl pyrophosphate synthase